MVLCLFLYDDHAYFKLATEFQVECAALMNIVWLSPDKLIEAEYGHACWMHNIIMAMLNQQPIPIS